LIGKRNSYIKTRKNDSYNLSPMNLRVQYRGRLPTFLYVFAIDSSINIQGNALYLIYE